MAAKHDHFVSFVGAGDLSDGVVRSLALGVHAVDDVEFQSNRTSIGEEARDATVVFVPHHDRRDSFVHVESSIIESPDLTMLAAGIVHANQRAVRFQERIKLLVDLSVRQRWWRSRRRRRSW